MSELRWILIISGAVLLIGIYFWGRRSDKPSAGSDGAQPRVRPEPHPAVRGPAPVFDASEPEASDLADDVDLPIESDFDSRPVRAHTPDDGIYVSGPTAHSRTGARADDLPADDLPRGSSREPQARDVRRGRVEPTFSDDGFREAAGATDDADFADDANLTEELPVREPSAVAPDAPTLAMSSTPQPKRIERRKIIALRLAAPAARYPGQQLREVLEAESLQYGKYDVFHCMHEDGISIFSVASMVEPGTFDLERMPGISYPGVTLFAQLPGPVAGVQALHDLVACGKRLQESLGGTLQDERGVPLTVHRVERLRQEIVDFERGAARDQAHRSPASPPQ